MTTPKTVYHATLKNSLPSILQYGLVPMIGLRSAECGETEPAIFCFPTQEDCDNAMCNWLGDSFDEIDDEIVYLEIAVTTQSSKSDADFEIAILENIAPDAIKMVFNEDWSQHEPFVNNLILVDEQDARFACA